MPIIQRLQSCTLVRHEKRAHIDALQREQFDLAVDASAVSGQTAVHTDNPVTGNDDAQWIMPDRPADGLRSHPRDAPLCRDLRRDLPVGHGLAVRDRA